MGFRDTFAGLFPAAPGAWLMDRPKRELTSTNEEIEVLFGRTSISTERTYRLPTVQAALGVPGIHRAVSLIAGTTGMLTPEGYQRGALMAETPRLLARPDPYQTQQAFYAGTASQMAKYGEFVWWIAKRDEEGRASALVLVPLAELRVQENQNDRQRPTYTWNNKTSTRYSPASQDGDFVHVKYPLADPFALRGAGPLQLCNVASSVSVEAQAWAAQFYAQGGNPSVVIKHAGELSPEMDEDGLNEADRLRAQWITRPHNVPRVIDQNIESVDYKDVGVNGAQMLDAREYQNGDAARIYGIPGSLMEYSAPGSSLTYQNLEGEFSKFVRGSLAPLYLVPIEQALSDLLPRSMSAQFNVDGFLRADIKTRYEVHGIAIDKGIYDPAYAQQLEGITAGSLEFAPIPFAPPAAIPAPLRAVSTDSSTAARCPQCDAVLRHHGKTGVDCDACGSRWRIRPSSHTGAA